MRIGSEAPKRRTHSSIGMKAKGRLGIPPPRTVIGVPSQAYGQGRNCRVPSASFVHCAARKTTPSRTMPSRTHQLPGPDARSGSCRSLKRSWRCRSWCCSRHRYSAIDPRLPRGRGDARREPRAPAARGGPPDRRSRTVRGRRVRARSPWASSVRPRSSSGPTPPPCPS